MKIHIVRVSRHRTSPLSNAGPIREEIVGEERLVQHVKGSPGFDDEHGPVMTQSQWGLSLHHYYNRTPHWVAG
ncbi:hypothetical protein [Burkholderia sp. PR2]|uniref:hypothetical protein n=1 Tax=Burkholderia sp. PR2 TaxID=3448078 RepID=UPI00402ACE3B